MQVWWVDEDGHPLRRDMRRSASAELVANNTLGTGYTDAQGIVELETGPAYGLLVIVAHGGQTTDPWIDATGFENVCLQPPSPQHAPEAEPLAERIVRVEDQATLPAVELHIEEVSCSPGDFLLWGSWPRPCA